VKITVKNPMILFDFLTGQYPDSPRTRVKKMLHSGTVRVNDLSVTLHSYALKPGDVVDINLHPGIAVKDSLPFPVLYEDQHIIAVDKPAGTSTSSVDGSQSIQKIVSEHLRKITKGTVRAFVVHRLDKEVSGVLLFAKSELAMNNLKENWKETEKHYYALVEGTPKEPEGTIKSWLVEDKSLKMHSAKESEKAKFAITHYTTIKQVNKNTLLDIKIETGRKNQIRVHLSDIGCPIVGDRKYGASAEFVRRIRLHAYYLSFPHPATGETLTLKSPMPEGFLSLKLKDEHYK